MTSPSTVPSLILRHNVASALYFAGRCNEAIGEARKVIEMDANFYLPYVVVGWCHMATGDKEAALVDFRKGLEVSHGSFWPLAYLGNAEARTGNRDEAIKILGRLSDLSKQRYVPASYFAMVYAGLNQKNQAFAELEKAFEERSDSVLFLKSWEAMASLRSDPRFADLARRVGLPP